MEVVANGGKRIPDLEELFEKILEPDTSHFLPWNIEMIYQVEPSLAEVVLKCRKNAITKDRYEYDVYSEVKEETCDLVGWNARDPRLRSTGAYDCFIHEVIDALEI